MDLLFEIYHDFIFIFYYMYSEISIRQLMDKPLWGLRVQAPFGAIGIGIGAVLSSIPEGACACGAEGHMASIGPLALGAKGCVERLHRFAQGAADWRSG